VTEIVIITKRRSIEPRLQLLDLLGERHDCLLASHLTFIITIITIILGLLFIFCCTMIKVYQKGQDKCLEIFFFRNWNLRSLLSMNQSRPHTAGLLSYQDCHIKMLSSSPPRSLSLQHLADPGHNSTRRVTVPFECVSSVMP
jgi:hypothetical protein